MIEVADATGDVELREGRWQWKGQKGKPTMFHYTIGHDRNDSMFETRRYSRSTSPRRGKKKDLIFLRRWSF
ncbi:hypothetical protein CV632_14985 [Geobacillus thermodenitrificans]|nr:hypothetical protein CV632_14985 [Geobacillus thermodenitrificans]